MAISNLTAEQVSTRLQALEEHVRRLRRWTKLLWSLVVVVLLAAARSPLEGGPSEASYEVVRARMFLVTDPEGTTRASFGLEDSEPRLALLNRTGGEARAFLSFTEHGSVLSLSDETASARASVFVSDKDMSTVALVGGEKSFVLLNTSADSSGLLMTRPGTNPSGVRVFAGAAGPLISLDDPFGMSRILLSSPHQLGPSVDVNDETGRTRASLGVNALTATQTGEARMTAPSKLVLYDKEGKVIFEAPRE